jgi:UDP:flavonoid glycosyltransferase YjiC (YdhE family)
MRREVPAVRILLTAQPIPSHIAPVLVPLGQALLRAGHDVRLATAAGAVEQVRGLAGGVPVLANAGMLTPTELTADSDLSAQLAYDGNNGLTDRADPASGLSAFLAGVLAQRSARGLFDVAAEWMPELIVREALEMSGVLLGERLQIPVVSIDTAPLEAGARAVALAPWLDRTRGELGLEERGLGAIEHGPWVSRFGPGWRPEGQDPSDIEYFRPVGVRGDTALERPGAATEPNILAAFGSLPNVSVESEASPVPVVVEALGLLGLPATVALYDDDVAARWNGARPANVRLEGHVDQPRLLQHSSVFISHAGFNSVSEAIVAGVPVLALPVHAEQPANAARIAELGLGLAFNPSAVMASELAEAVQTLLDDSRYRENAQRWRAKLAALPDEHALVKHVVSFGL